MSCVLGDRVDPADDRAFIVGLLGREVGRGFEQIEGSRSY